MSNRGRPLLDIVMLVHDQAAWTDLAIRAVEHHTHAPYRLILVDSASRQAETRAVLQAARARGGHTLLTLPENRSFSNGVNVGVAAGSAPHVVLLNSDALVTEGWDGALLQDLANRDVGLVGARSNAVSGAQGDPGFLGDPPWLAFVCVALRRQIWDVVGPMDEATFDGWSSEDLDYSWRVVKAGYRLRVSSAFVLHAGSRTLAAEVGDAGARAANDARYNRRLTEKWGEAWVRAHSKLRESVLLVSFHYHDWCPVDFKDAWLGLKRSDGVTFSFNSIRRAPIAFGRMKAADFALDQGFDVLIMVDDDAMFPPDLVRRLLAHQKDVVTALAYQRKPPHWPCIFADDGDGSHLMAAPLMDAEHTGLRVVARSGLHVAMVRTGAIAKLRDAGIREYFGGWDNKVGEDFAFCLNLRKVGVPVHCDTELICPHLADPVRVDEAYVKAYRLATAPPPSAAVPAQINGQPLVVLR